MCEKTSVFLPFTFEKRLTIMSKTKEELKEIKKEVIQLSEKLKELTDEELNIVTGGAGGVATSGLEMIQNSERLKWNPELKTLGFLYVVVSGNETIK